jgi:hypothetical protein
MPPFGAAFDLAEREGLALLIRLRGSRKELIPFAALTTFLFLQFAQALGLDFGR